MTKLLALLLVAPTLALADPYIEVGIGMKFGKCDCPRMEDPVGIVAVGYRIPDTGFRIDVEHRSSLSAVDYGQNIVSIRHRWGD